MSSGKQKQIPSGVSRRRAERANVRLRLKGVKFKSQAFGNKEIRVLNISEYGMGLETSDIPQVPASGTAIDGKLSVGMAGVPVRARLVHQSPELTGVEFIEPSEMLRGAIQSYFDAELAGATLRPHPQNPQGTRTGSHRVRYGTRDASELELELQQGAVRFLMITMLGNRIEWKEPEGLRVARNGGFAPIDDFLRSQALKFVQSAEFIDPAHRALVEAVLVS